MSDDDSVFCQEPLIADAICIELLIKVSVSKFVILVEKLALDSPNEPDTLNAERALMSAAFLPSEPLMSAAICAELLTMFGALDDK
jgi:hypothetical protein